MATPNTPIVNAGLKYVNGLELARTGNKTITVAAGACRNSTNVNDIVLDALVTNTGTHVGANGVDLAAIVLSSFYAVYLIGDSTGNNATASLLSLSSTSPNLPGGYDMFRRIGYILTDGSANILLFWQYGHGNDRIMYYDAQIAAPTTAASTSYANISLATSVPPIATRAIMRLNYTANGATDVLSFVPYGSSATGGVVNWGPGSTSAAVQMLTIPLELNSTAPTFSYKSAATATLVMLTAGYEDSL